MKYVQLGKTNLIVSRICFGCWQLSPRWWGEVPLDDWRAAADSALDLGVNFFDTADAYGDGFAESALGDWMAERKCRDKLIVATKFFWSFEQAQRVPDTSHDYILRECEASLKRLRTDRIDLYQIHSWDPLTRPDEVAAAFGKLKKEGKVRWFGVSNLNVEQMSLYLKHFDIECLQPPYNMIERGVESRELPFCLEKRIGVITYSTLAKGLLTGKYSPDQEFADAARADDSRFKGERFARILRSVQALQPIADQHGLTLPQLAVRWVLTHPAVTSAIVGVKRPEHIETIVAAADDILPARDWYNAAGIISKTS